MNTQLLIMVVCTVVLLAYAGCLLHEGAYRGRVIDEETRMPIKDVVALGVWYEERCSVAFCMPVYRDARETVTDEHGDFVIPGHGFRTVKGPCCMHVTVFKAGYSHASGFWMSTRNPKRVGASIMEGDKLVIPLRKLSTGDMKKHAHPPRPPVPLKAMRLLTGEINKDRVLRGMGPLAGVER